MRPPIEGFWAKLRQDEGGQVQAWQPLWAHCLDVGVMAEGLLRGTALGQRLAIWAGLPGLSDWQIARLAVLAALHDLGKFNHGFQNKAQHRPAFTAGHVGELLALMQRGGSHTAKLCDAIDYRKLASWVDDESVMSALLRASFCHHGRPRSPERFMAMLWRPGERGDPFAGMRELSQLLKQAFAQAWSPDVPPLPSPPALAHAFNGLLTLADWIASDEGFFPFHDDDDDDTEPVALARSRAQRALQKLQLDARPARQALGTAIPGFDRVADFSPRPLQQAVQDLAVPEQASVVVLEAPTGAGKTEAALLHFLRLHQAGLVDGLYFALPTRTAATQIHKRVYDVVQRAFAGLADPPSVTQAVPGYLAVDDKSGRPLPGFKVLWSDRDQDRWRHRGWAAEHPKRYLAGAISVGTIDQVLLSALEVSHAHMRAVCLARVLLVVDEVHASDTYMTTLLQAVLQRHLAAGGHAFLMSATLGNRARSALLGVGNDDGNEGNHDASAPYPLLSVASGAATQNKTFAHAASKRVEVELDASMGEPAAVAGKALAAADKGARVLVLRNTVTDCLATQVEIEAQARDAGREDLLHRCRGLPAPHHSRYARSDRQALDAAIEMSFGKQRETGGRIAVATQTVQQSLDLDADLMITDLCPMDVLLQRVGRLHRHQRPRPQGFEQARVCVLVPEQRDLSPMINSKSGEARGEHGLGTVYGDLRIIEATWRQLEAREALQIPADNRALVEACVDPATLDTLAASLGSLWKAHQQHVMGVLLSQGVTASLRLVDWSQTYLDTHFASLDQHIGTRLGEGDRRIELDATHTSPFGNAVTHFDVPEWMARGLENEFEVKVEQSAGGDLHIQAGSLRYAYSRLGLRKI